MKDRCQSCREAPVAVTETPEGFYEPLEVCAACHRRLTSHSLRPSEWYNLSSIHGNLSELLGDEFYDEADGQALAPSEPVIDARRSWSSLPNCLDRRLRSSSAGSGTFTPRRGRRAALPAPFAVWCLPWPPAFRPTRPSIWCRPRSRA